MIKRWIQRAIHKLGKLHSDLGISKDGLVKTGLELDNMTDDDLEKIPTLMYGRFGDNAIEF